jgi:hypothetical protein
VAGDAVSAVASIAQNMQMHVPGVFGSSSNDHQNVYFHELIGGHFEIWRPS